jgi:hypothetical protein
MGVNQCLKQRGGAQDQQRTHRRNHLGHTHRGRAKTIRPCPNTCCPRFNVPAIESAITHTFFPA